MGALVVLRAVVEQPERFCALLVAGGTARFLKTPQIMAFRAGLRAAYGLTLRNFIKLPVPERDVCVEVRGWGLALLTQARSENARRLAALM